MHALYVPPCNIIPLTISYDGPGRGLTHVPLDHRVAGMVKSPGFPSLVYCKRAHKRYRTRFRSMCTYGQSEKVGKSCLQSSKGKVESAAHVALYVVYEEGKSVPTLVIQAVWYMSPRDCLIR